MLLSTRKYFLCLFQFVCIYVVFYPTRISCSVLREKTNKPKKRLILIKNLPSVLSELKINFICVVTILKYQIKSYFTLHYMQSCQNTK